MYKVIIYGEGGGKAAELLRAEGYAVRTERTLPDPLPTDGADAALFLPSLGERALPAARAFAARNVAAVIVGDGERGDGAGVFRLRCPVSPATLLQTLSVALEMNARLRDLEEENLRLRCEMTDLKAVDRAKCALIRRFGMTERSAHRLIEKRSMDLRLPRRQIALQILKEYSSEDPTGEQ